jgi:hypothetical protein
MYKRTREEMEKLGWAFDSSPARPCRDCGEPVFWGRNPKTGRNVSFDYGGTEFHFRHCGAAAAAVPASSIPLPRPAASATPASAPAPADLQASIDALTAEIRRLTSALQSRRAPVPTDR